MKAATVVYRGLSSGEKTAGLTVPLYKRPDTVKLKIAGRSQPLTEAAIHRSSPKGSPRTRQPRSPRSARGIQNSTQGDVPHAP